MTGPPPVARVRFARPTDQLDEVVRFYRDGVGLPVLGGFEGHAGYTGVMLGLPGADPHLEFTTHEDGSPCPAPTRDNLMVLYFAQRAAIDEITDRLAAMGYPAVEPENPWWGRDGVTVADPDGWRLVLMWDPGVARPA